MTGSATRSINPESYGALLTKYLPMPITSEEDNEQALEVVQTLMATVNETLAKPKHLRSLSFFMWMWVCLLGNEGKGRSPTENSHLNF